MKKILFSYLYILIITVVSYSEVMIQGFYWDCPINWYTQISEKIDTLQNMHSNYGINRIWLPPLKKVIMELIPWDMIHMIIMIWKF